MACKNNLDSSLADMEVSYKSYRKSDNRHRHDTTQFLGYTATHMESGLLRGMRLGMVLVQKISLHAMTGN
eukprot:CAMPEP_0183773896 /NCGR_PEP_ID=MMETSP0739-20130205/40474_1 /TAXON_ID=385413 /ORGANISM="Thalassiosira miniscula, Strain CCMP1093" /LENGTH=69 /DNA_ID=CAMNT_0026015035 /DNA_START=613 /DNA_END=819 /DNA_ORIENTATION=-